MKYYLADSGISSSLLKNILISPADFLQARKQDNAATRSTVLGTAIHTWLLEPEKFYSTYACQTENWGPRNIGDGAKRWKAFKKENEGKIFLGFEENKILNQLNQVSSQHKPYNELMFGNSRPTIEQSMFYEDPVYGRLKCRPDIFTQDGWIWDIKSTSKDVDDESLSRTIFNFTYHFQAAHYIYVMTKLGHDIKGFGWIFVSTETPIPHLIMRTARKELLEAGKIDHRHALNLYKHCLEVHEWPGPDTSVKDIGLPKYAERIYS